MGVITSGEKNLKLLNILAFFKSFNTIHAVLVIYFSQVTGSFASAMFVLSLVNLSAAFFETPTGVFSDNIGRKKTLLLYYVTGALGFIFYYYANSVDLLALGAITLGFSLAMRSGTIQAYVYENLEAEGKITEFKNYEGLRRSLERYSLVVATIVGAVIIKYADIKTALIVTIAFRLVTIFIALSLTDLGVVYKASGNIYSQIGKAWKHAIKNPTIKNIGIARIISFGGGNLAFRFRALFYQMLIPDWLINIVGVFSALVSAFAMKNANKIIAKVGLVKSLVVGQIFFRLSIAVLIFINSYVTPFLMTFIGSTALGIREIADVDILQKNYTPEQRATLGSLIGLGNSLFYSILGIGVGFIADTLGVKYTLLLLQPLLATAAIFYWKGIKYHKALSNSA